VRRFRRPFAVQLDRSKIAQLLALAGEQLAGDWVLLGAAATTLWFAPHRTTDDFELVSLAGADADRLALFAFANGAGLAPEAVDADDFHLRRIDGWQRALVELHRGSRAAIFRPNGTLFVLLALHRLAESDVDDCISLLTSGERVDAPRLFAAIAALPETGSAQLDARRSRLLAAIP
jgi:hypothetical protein